ncbi:hypothetical protein FB45DRAFT_976818 [Roridomyces roridus]|uniref:RNase III domain-containing protein n=1 Tax=Roridomyces roridus TaxID=1738132 RepID=A0AAD7FRH2_9AGAR|nr:hypothetical protein FB45DRAFT_976818 [Roridomyces roridus]
MLNLWKKKWREQHESPAEPGPSKSSSGSSGPEPDNASCSPTEVVLLYDKVHTVVETDLVGRIRSLDESECIYGLLFDDARHVGANVGPCAADLVWRRALKSIDTDVSPYCEDEADDGPLETLNRTKRNIRDTVKNWSFTIPNLDTNSQGFNVTPKFLRLVQILESFEPYGEEFRGIVLVHRRATAFAIADLVPMLGEQVSFIRVHAIGEVFRKFQSGIYNLLIATKAVEDLDIPNSLVVIRFDLFEGDVSRAYSLSMTTNHLVHLLERSNNVHRHNLLSTTSADPDMVRWQNMLVSSPMSAAPPRPIVVPSHVDCIEEGEALEEPVAGGRIYIQDATAVVYRLASTTSTTSFPAPLFEFSTCVETSSYSCTVLLPGTPAHNVAGPACPSMTHARRAACFAVCIKLAEAGLLEPEAFPIRPQLLPNVNASKRVEGLGMQTYLRKGPDFWKNPTGAVALLYPTIITMHQSNQPLHAPILFLTRYPLPLFSPFRLFFSKDPAVIKTCKGKPFKLSDEKIVSLHMYTMRLCRAVANKAFICSLEDMPFFLAPLASSWVPTRVDWPLGSQAAASWSVPVKYGQADVVAEDVQDAVLMDRATELTRRYDILRVRSDLSPLSCPEDCSRAMKHGSLLKDCEARLKNFTGLKDEAQTIVEISILQAVSRIDPASRPPEVTDPPRYLIPELCGKLTIPASTFRMALLFPSIARRLDSFLLVKELNARFFNHQISENLLDMAITAPSARMEYDYERLELLGDSFLKYLTSIYVFVNEPANKEGALHFARQNIISNRALFRNFQSAGLPPYVQSRPFGFKFWLPPNFRVSDPQGETQGASAASRKRMDNEQRLGDKVSRFQLGSLEFTLFQVVADVSEAILGAAYLSGGRDTALMAAKAMNLPFPNVEKWSDFGYKLLMPPPTVTAKLSPKTINAVEAIVKHKFKYPHLLAQALTHASVSAAERVSYERLEFIGDAILDFLVIRYVFERQPRLAPGGLTILKGAMVSNSALAAFCISCGLHNHLLLVPRLSGAVAEYAEKLEAKRTAEYELARIEQRPPWQYWHDIEAPKALSDVVESVIGAIYISDGATPAGVETFFDAVLKPFFDAHITLKTIAHHPSKTLLELIQAQRCQKFKISKERVKNVTLCHVLVHDVILASGEGQSISLAAKNASWCALDALEGDADFFLRNCDCSKEGADKGKAQGYQEIISGLEE